MTDWQDEAACRETDPERFFPLPKDIRGVERAKAVCVGCPVRAECLGYALAAGLDHGIFGGTTEDERRTLKHRARPRLVSSK